MFSCCMAKKKDKKNDQDVLDDKDKDKKAKEGGTDKARKKPLTEAQRKKARENWRKLRDHIK